MREEEIERKMDAFATACKEAINFYKQNCNPHEHIVIDHEGCRICADTMGIPLSELD